MCDIIEIFMILLKYVKLSVILIVHTLILRSSDSIEILSNHTCDISYMHIYVAIMKWSGPNVQYTTINYEI